MTDFRTRLDDELSELSNRMDLLSRFIGNEGFAELTIPHRKLLSMQLDAMNKYHSVLVVRVALLDAETGQ